MQWKYVDDVDSLTNIIRGKSYHIMDIKDPNHVIFMMTAYGMLKNLEGLDMQWRYKGSGEGVVTKWFNYCELFGNHFHYRHQVDNNNKNRHYLISVERA